MKTKFPQGFLWGAATAAHQVEGNNTNSDFWVLERLPGTIFKEPSGDAIDHYNRYPQDISLVAGLGFNSYRFSIEWARIEPENGYFSNDALNHYRQMLIACRDRNLKPMVTLHHFTSPQWLIQAGGWRNPDTSERFAHYCARVVRYMGDLIDSVCTINELNLPGLIRYLVFPDYDSNPHLCALIRDAEGAFGLAESTFSSFLFAGSDQERKVILNAHKQSVLAIKAERCDLPVGMTIAMPDLQAESGGEALRDRIRLDTQDVFIEAARHDDFVGVQTYSRERIGPGGRLLPEEGIELTQVGYEFCPEALESTIRYTYQLVDTPIIITENGIATTNDSRRLEYYSRALKGVTRCLNDDVDIRGYYAWSAFDNFEWMLGYKPTFGLIAVDRKTQERTVKPSGRWLGEIAQSNEF